jgi:hypothetical protein
MRSRAANVLVLVVAVASLSLAVSCGARRNASQLSEMPPNDAESAYAPASTREQALYESDVMRVQELEEFHDDMDERLRLLDDGARVAALQQQQEEETFGDRAGRFFEKVGVASYAVLSVAMTLGMAALPFLI